MRLSLQAKMFLIFALVATLPLLAMSYIAVGQAEAAFRDEVGASHHDSALTAAAFVDVYVQGALAQVQAEAHSPRLRDAVESESAAQGLLEVADFQARTSYRSHPVFASVVLLNETGTVLAAHPSGTAEAGTRNDNWLPFVAARARGNATALTVERTDASVTLPMSAPVFVNGTFQGVLVADMSFEGLAEGLQTFTSREASRVLLFDLTGAPLVDPTKDVRAAWHDTVPLRAAQRGASGSAELTLPGTDLESLAGYAPVAQTGWTLVSFEPTSTAYEGVARLRAVLLVLAADLLIAMLLASALVARAVVKPVRRLTQAADAMAQGRLSTRIQDTGADEMGDLARMFNVMAERVGSNVEDARRSEERYRSLVESANDLIFSVEPDGTLSFASALAERVLGAPGNELVGNPASARVHPADRSVFETAVASVLETGRPLAGVQYRVVAEDGTTRTVLTNLSPVMTQLDVPGRVLGVSRDVTEEREQERLREQGFEMARVVSEHAELEPLLANGLDILLASAGLARGAAFVRRTDRLTLLAARRMPPVAGTDWVDALMPRADEALQDVYERSAPDALRTHGVHVVHAIPLIERGETLGLVLLFADAETQLDAPRAQALGALASQLAVGIRRSEFEARLRGYASELESKVEQRTAMLLEKSQEMETFLYSVSHDLKAPLISIEGYAQGLQEDYGATFDEDAAYYVERIRKNAELMESLISDLLEFNRIGRVRESAGPVDVKQVLDEITGRLQDAYGDHGGRIDIAESLPVVHGERKRIAQLFNNLLGNALKYRDPARPPQVAVRGRLVDDQAEIEIEDNGRGMPTNAKDKAFQLFQRFPHDTHPDPGGTGMGLAIVKRIVETHGGSIDFTSEPGEGTTFRVRLPLRAPTEPRRPGNRTP